MNEYKIKNLFYPSGALKGYATIGALEWLETQNLLELNDTSTRVSASIGTLIALCHIIYSSTAEIKKRFDKYDIEDIFNCNFRLFDEPDNEADKMGLDDGSVIIDMILTEANIDKTTTFNDFVKTYPSAKNWYIMITSVEGQDTVYAGVKTHGGELLYKLLYASCCIPLFYRPMELEDGFLYVDGAVVDTLPLIFMFKSLSLDPKNTLLMYINGKCVRKTKIMKDELPALSYFNHIFNLILTNHTTISHHPSVVTFNIPDTIWGNDKDGYMNIGKREIKKHFNCN